MPKAARLGAVAAVLVMAVGQPALAAPAKATDLAGFQQQLDALRSEYDAKISALEARLKAAEEEVAAAKAEPEAGSSEVAIAEIAPPVEPATATASASAMNPGVSVVLNGNYVGMSRDPALARMPGFALGDEAGPPSRGFSLGESEVTLAANVDPYLTANLTVAFGFDNEASVEEAYVQTTALPAGLTLKAGRFFSGVGYLNERHAHNWSFIDMPLPYRALLGNQYGDDGVQVRWLAPTPFFLEAGAEAFRGDGFPAGSGAGDRNRPGAWSAFVHTGSDLSDASSWLGALSYLHTDARGRDTGGDIFDGENGVGIASLVYKWAPGGNPRQRNLTLSAEYFLGKEQGDFNGVAVSRDQRGWYAQGVYQFTPRWRAGLRYAEVKADGVPLGLAGSTLDPLGRTPKSVSALLEYDSSEFGRFRLEYSRDRSDLRPIDQLMLQYTVVYGPHGAHRY